MKLRNIFIALASILLLGSCESWLDLKPHDQLAYDVAFKDIPSAEIAMRGCYLEMHRQGGYYDGLHLILPDVMADNVILCSEGRLTMDLCHNWEYKAGNFYVSQTWGSRYVVINRCNQVIARVPNIVAENEEEEALKNHILGEAYALRGMAYFDLVRFFGKNYVDASDSDLGVPYQTDPDPSSPPRDNVSTVYTNLVADLEEGVRLMGLGAIDPAEGNTRLSSMAATALLARVYLTMERWDDAIAAATTVIDAYNAMGINVTSAGSFEAMWRDEVDETVLFKVKIHEQDGTTIGTYYSQTSPDGTRSEYVMSYEMYQLLTSTADVRGTAWIRTGDFNNKTFNHIWKYNERTGASTPDMVDGKVIRMDEVYLIRAEASMRRSTPDEATAGTDLDLLRDQRYAAYTGGETGQNLLDAIMYERRLELAFEGQRFFDLKRLGESIVREDFGDEADGTGLLHRVLALPAGSDKWEFPIPTSEMDANNNMVQNPGY